MLASGAQQGTTIIISGWEIIGFLVFVLWLLARYARRRGRQQLELMQDAEREQLTRRMSTAPRYRRPGQPGYGEQALPAACIASPPSAHPVVYVPSACRHEKILPVITDAGELVRWVCANPRCMAEFDRSVAMYEAEAGREHG